MRYRTPIWTEHHYENAYLTTCILKFSPPKNEKFQIKISGIFHISAQNIDCGYSSEPPRRGGSDEYPQIVLSRNKNNNVYPCKPQFYYIKVGFKGDQIYIGMFSWCMFVRSCGESRARFCVNKAGLSPCAPSSLGFSTGPSKAFFSVADLVCASVVY